MLPSTTKRLRNTTTPAVTRRPLTTLTPLKGTLRTRENMESMRAALIARSMETRLEEIDERPRGREAHSFAGRNGLPNVWHRG
jgi:hypothetical protein